MTTTTSATDPASSWPACPTCGSVRRACTRPSGRPAPEWHPERTALWEDLPDTERQRLAQIIDRPRVRVQIVPGTTGEYVRYSMWCQHCTGSYTNSVKTDVQEVAKRHRDDHRAGRLAVA